MKRLGMLLMVCILVVQLAVPALAQQEQVELLLYHHLAEMVPIFDEFCAHIQEKYPNIILTQELQKESSTLQVKYASGDDPDIVIGPQTQQYIELGKYNDLSNMPGIDRLDPLCYDIVYDQDLKGIFKVPLCNRSGGLFYNKSIVEKLGLNPTPQTWDEWVENMRTIKREMPDVVPYYMYNSAHPLAYVGFGTQMEAEGAVNLQWAMNRNDSEILQFDKPGGYLETYAQRILDLLDEGLIDPELSINGNDSMGYEMFATDKTCYITSGTFWYSGCVQAFPETAEKFGLAPIPATVDGMGPFTVAGPDSAVSSSATNPHQEEIALVVAELFSDEFLKKYSEKRGAPAAFSGIDSDWSTLKEDVKHNWETYPIITQMTPVTGFGLSDIAKFHQELIVGAFTPEEWAKEFKNRWDTAYINASRK